MSNLGARDEVYHACRALLVHRQEQIAIFDRAFDAFWRAHRAEAIRDAPPRRNDASASASSSRRHARRGRRPAETDERAGRRCDRPPNGLTTWSDRGGTREQGLRRVHRGRTRRGARGAGAPGLESRRAPDAAVGARTRPAHRSSARDRRQPAHRRRRRARCRGGRRRIRPRPLVLLCDVSGSMERYSRMLLHFAHALTRRHRGVEAFLFSTELTRITRQLRCRGPDDALAAVSRAVTGLVRRHAHRRRRSESSTSAGAAACCIGGPVVLLISDGWDRGDPGELRDQIARLQRSCHRLVWLNPLIGTADYAPLTRGLQAALPFVDDFLPARTLNNLADLAIHLNALA